MTGLIERLAERPVVVVLRAASVDRFADVGRVLLQAGLSAVEVTLTTPGAFDAIAAARRNLPAGAIVGAGTVRTVAQATAAMDAGAEFLVSQVAPTAAIAAAAARGIPFIPGALTPTEIVAAWEIGVEAVKVSPVGPVGGLDYISELVGPLPEIPLFPTGGVQIEHAVDYLEAGAALVGLSRDLVQDSLQRGGDLDALASRARQVVHALDRRWAPAARRDEEITV